VTTGYRASYISSWSDVTGHDEKFQLSYFTIGASVTATGVTSAEHTVRVVADGTNLKIYIDGVEKDSVALAGASVPNNASNWTFIKNYSMPYMEYLKIWVGGTLRQHIIWENDTTFTDLSGNGNDATPTFRTTTTDADVSTTVKNFGAVSQATYTGADSDEGPEMVSDTDIPAQPSGWYVNLHAEDLPVLGEPINNLLEDQGIPPQAFWLPFVYIGGAVITMVAFRFTRKLMPSAMGGIIWNAFFGVVIGSGMWGLFPIAIISVGEMANRKKVSW
jgi:hypothetical protein